MKEAFLLSQGQPRILLEVDMKVGVAATSTTEVCSSPRSTALSVLRLHLRLPPPAVEPCGADACYNGGYCVNNTTCVCMPGFTGHDCSTYNDTGK